MSPTVYRSSGKLLISGEYAVLDGALALALPTNYGQTLKVTPSERKGLSWYSKDQNGQIWFSMSSANYTMDSGFDQVGDRLDNIFKFIRKKRPDLFDNDQGYEFISQIEFPQHWGLGSSSSLISNLAQWAEVDAYALLEHSFGGSGYDVAVALQNQAILYKRTEDGPWSRPIALDWPFTDQLYFVYLNKKQDSREAIAQYRAHQQKPSLIQEINAITWSMVDCSDLKAFEELIVNHEELIAEAIKMDPVQQRLFKDYPGRVKSLGGWGGDFVLATGNESTPDYFKSKGHHTVLSFDELIKKAP